MSGIQTLRLSEFWRDRLQPLLGKSSEVVSWRMLGATVYEAAGWLIEGVFCGYFDAREADVVWVQIESQVRSSTVPDFPLFMPTITTGVRNLIGAADPFQAKDRMTQGAQREFELPLFPHALMLANRLHGDRLARVCTNWLTSGGEKGDSLLSSVDSLRVLGALANPVETKVDAAAVLAGYLRLLEHMEQSRRFFKFAESRSSRNADFESYCQRIGGLTAWHVPAASSTLRERFDELAAVVQKVIMSEVREQYPKANREDFENAFRQHVGWMMRSWESYHLSEALARA